MREIALATEDITVLRACVRWRRANRWTFERVILGSVCWRSGQGVIVDADFVSDGVVLGIDFGKHSETFEPRSIREAVDVLAAFGILPASLSSMYAAGHADGFAEGCDAVTELSVTNLVDVELDKLDDDSVQAELTNRIRHRLADPDDPYETRAATKEIVESVWHVLERAS